MRLNYRTSLLLGTSILAINAVLTGAVLLGPESAYACTAVNSDTTVGDSSDACINWTGGNLTITGSGVVSSASHTAVSGSGTSGNLTNSGKISGGTYNNAINNSGIIGTINNSGTISVGAFLYDIGIENNATIGAINNNAGGVISGASFGGGIFNYYAQSIGTITNSGTISSGASGIFNSGSLGGIINSGTISSGDYAIINNSGGTLGGGATAILSTGTIIGAIYNSATIVGNIIINQDLTISGGTGGYYGAGTGTLVGGTITANNLTFDSSAHQILSDNIVVGSGSGTVTNSGILEVGTAQSIVGNYVQGSLASLVIDVTNSTTYGELIISGTAMVGGSISVDGNLTPGETFTIVQASNAGSDYSAVTLSSIAHDLTATASFVVNGSFDDLVITIGTNCQVASGGANISGTVACVIWTGSNLTIAGSGMITGSDTGIINTNNTVGAVTNNGSILGSLTGIYNGGSIAAIVNNSIISANNGILNDIGGTIGTITNNSTISGSGNGIDNAGNIGSIANSGVIRGAVGITDNSYTGSIGTISNSGTITGTGVGIYINYLAVVDVINNTSTIHGGQTGINGYAPYIGSIMNSGTISGNRGIELFFGGSVGAIDNSGMISGQHTAISADIAVGTIGNSGIISGGTYGIIISDTINSFTNSGLIEGPSAIASSGTILSAISNAGTIAGNLNVSQALTITGGSTGSLGTLTGYNGTIGTITTNNNDLTFDANAYQLMDDDINVGASNTVFNDGLIRVNTTHSITGNYNQSASGTLMVGVTDPTHYGQLLVSGAAILTGSNVLITPMSGSLTNGETLTIVQAATSGTNYNGVTATASGFTATTSSIAASGNEDLIVTLSSIPSGGGGGGGSGGGSSTPTYVQIGALAGSNGAAVGTALDQLQTNIANGNNANFAPVLAALNTIGTQQGAAAEGAAIKQLAPGQLSASVGATNLTANESRTVIGQHQQNLRRSGTGSTGQSAGSEYSSGALWMQVSGGFANSTTAGAGYHQSYYGLTFGADDKISRNATLGLAVGWSHNAAQGANDLSGDNVSTSTPELMGYGTYRIGQAYLDGMLGVGYNMFSQSRSIGFLNAVASSYYGGMQYMGNAETGYDFAVSPRTTMTPLVGFNAVRTDTNGYTESGAGPADTSVGRQIIDSYATTLGGRVTTALPTKWGSLLPEAKLGWLHDLNGSPVSSNATLQGVSFATSTPRTAQDGAEVSLGATLQRTDALSLRAEYDGDLRSDYQSHTGLLKGEWKF